MYRRVVGGKPTGVSFCETFLGSILSASMTKISLVWTLRILWPTQRLNMELKGKASSVLISATITASKKTLNEYAMWEFP